MSMTLKDSIEQMLYYDKLNYEECKEIINTKWRPEVKKEGLLILETMFKNGVLNPIYHNL